MPKQAAIANLKAQATEMKKALEAGDYVTFIRYQHHYIVSRAGGEAELEASLRRRAERLRESGVHMETKGIAEPFRMVKDGGELQSSVVHYFKYIHGDITAAGTNLLLAFSEDEGEHWTFADLMEINPMELYAILPNLSPEVITSQYGG